MGLKSVISAIKFAGKSCWSKSSPQIFYLGTSIYDVRTEGGGGVPSKADLVSNISKGGCMNLRTGGGKGSKNPKFWRTSLMEAPKVSSRHNNVYDH